VVEQGSHSELLAIQGYYYALVTADPTITQGKAMLLFAINLPFQFSELYKIPAFS
jgi:hypothetical protein